MTFRPALALALALLLSSGLSAAETSPYYIGVSQGFSHDSNVYRIDDSTLLPAPLRKGDTLSSTSLLAGIDQPIGRQRLFGNATLRANRFKDNDQLNNQAYSASLGLDWSTINRLSGSLSASGTQSLARFNPDNDIPTLLKKNTERTGALDGKIRLGLVTRWTAEAALSHRQVSYSAEEFRSREYVQDMLSAGLRYSPSAGINFGAALRHTDGKYERYRAQLDGSFLADRYKRNDVDFTSTWIPSAASLVSGRISIGRVEHSEAVRRDFSGSTGLVRWQWKPSAKFTLNTSLTRDTGEDISYADSGSSSNTGSTALATNDLSRTTTALRLQADYELSAKIALSAGASSSRRTLVDTFTFGNGGSFPRDGRDTTNSFNFGARWQPTRSLQLNCDLSRDRRSASGTLSDAFSVTSYGCTGQFVMQ